MGTSRSPAELSAKLRVAAREVGDETHALNVVGKYAKTVFLVEAGTAGVGRGFGRSKVARGIGARYDVLNRDVVVKYTGPAHLVNNPTQPHWIEPKDTDGALLLTDGNLRKLVFHPGTRGKRFYEKAKQIVEQAAPRMFQREQLTKPLARAFK